MFLLFLFRNFGWNRLVVGKGSFEKGLEGVGGNKDRKKDRSRGYISVKFRVVGSFFLVGVVFVKNFCYY